MAVYQCKSCQRCYGQDSRIPQLKPIDWKTIARYADSDTWQCPHCGMHQDSRDLQPFLGCGGNSMLKELTEKEIQTIINPVAYHFTSQHGYPFMQCRFRI